MGFRVASIRFPEGPFDRLFASVCPKAAILVAVLRRCNTLPNVVFLDLLSLPLVSCLCNSYWRAWVAPHVFFLWAGDMDLVAPGGRGRLAQVAPQPPRGWSSREVTLTHCEAGGGTSGRWQIIVRYPPERAAPSPAPLNPVPWFPL